MKKQYRVNIHSHKDSEEVIARVRYNAALDYWDGQNMSNGGQSRHKGITKLKNGEYVIIHGSDWQGSRDYGYIVSAEEALQEILKADRSELLNTKKFKALKALYKDTLQQEDNEDEDEEER